MVRELERFLEPMLHDHIRMYELHDGQVLWSHEDPKTYGYYGSLWPSEDALWRHVTAPRTPADPPRKMASTIASTLGSTRPP